MVNSIKHLEENTGKNSDIINNTKIFFFFDSSPTLEPSQYCNYPPITTNLKPPKKKNKKISK